MLNSDMSFVTSAPRRSVNRLARNVANIALISDWSDNSQLKSPDRIFPLLMGMILYGFRYEPKPGMLRVKAASGILRLSRPQLKLKQSDVFRWKHAAEAVR